MEAECGLTEYAVQSDASPIKCELKRLYSDFIVNEILTDGTLALSSESGPSKEDSAAAKCEGPASKRPSFFSDEDCRKIEEVAKGTLESHSIPSKVGRLSDTNLSARFGRLSCRTFQRTSDAKCTSTFATAIRVSCAPTVVMVKSSLSRPQQPTKTSKLALTRSDQLPQST